MRPRSTAVLAVIALTALAADSPQRADCTFDAAAARTRPNVWRQLSADAETVAPSRRRAIKPPSTEQTFTRRNFIDSEIFGKMVRDRIRWTDPSSDAEFLRRVSLDLTGQIPTAERVKSFLADTSADKRDKLIDELLASEGFVERWSLWFGDHVQNVRAASNIFLYQQGRNAYYTWITESFRAGKPYDVMVRELLSTRGASFTSGAVNYWVRQIQTNGPLQDTFDNLAADSAQKFLGLPLNCLSCHNGLGHLEAVNSGLVRRTRLEFWKNAAFFATDNHRPRVDEPSNAVEFTVDANLNPGRARYTLNTTSGNKTPRIAPEGQANTVLPAFFLSGETPAPGELPRVAYARILTANPQFARASVNYIWKEIFGAGIVEPADSFDLLRQDEATLPPGATLQPTHPQLLRLLADHFAASGYDMRALLRTIVQSNAYQLSAIYTPATWNETWASYYPRHYPRRMLAESVIDAIARATNVPPPRMNVVGLQIDRAMQLPDPTEPRTTIITFLNAFGRGDRDTTPRSREGSIVQALSMLNDPFLTTRVRAANNSTVQRVLATTTDAGAIADELYIATLSRRPTANERAAAIEHLRSGEITRQAEDLQYVLLNRLEFLYY